MMALIFGFWLFYLVSSVPICLLIAFLGRRRADWKAWELCVFIVPFAAWILCYLIFPTATAKGIIQPFYEAFLLGAGVPIIAGIRVIVGRKLLAWPFSAILVAVLSAVGFGVATFVPRLMPVD